MDDRQKRPGTRPVATRRTVARIALLSVVLLAACSGASQPSNDPSTEPPQGIVGDAAPNAPRESANKTYSSSPPTGGDSAPDLAPPRPSDAAALRPPRPPRPDESDGANEPASEPSTTTRPNLPAGEPSGPIDESEQLILPADPEANDEFAWSLGLGGDLLLSGAPLADDNGGNSGAAYLFRWDGTAWEQIAKLVPGDGAEGDWFGKSAAVFGDTAVVGANLDDGPLRGEFFDDDTGSVYVFVRQSIGDGEIWQQEAKLRAPEQLEWAEFGFDVAIHGDTLAVGAYHDSTLQPDGGAVYVFRRGPDDWLLETRLLPSGGAVGDEFGTAIALQDDTLIVGSPGDDGSGPNAGAAFVYRRDGRAWQLESVLRAPGGVEFDAFGFSVGLSGDSAIVGAPFHDGGDFEAGAAYLFERSEATWAPGTRLLPADPAMGAWFGRAVALTPNFAVIGAPRFDRVTHDGIPNERFAIGKTYVFERTPTGWVEQAELLADGGSDGDDFGWTLAAGPGMTVVGAWLADTDSGPDAGLAYSFLLPE